MKEVKEDSKELQKNRDELLTEKAKLDLKLDSVTAENKRLKDKLDRFDEEKAQQQIDSSAKDKEIAELKANLNAVESNAAKAEEDNAKKTQEIEKLKNEHKTELAIKQKEIEELKNQLTAENEKLKEQISSMSGDSSGVIESLQKDNELLNEKLRNLNLSQDAEKIKSEAAAKEYEGKLAAAENELAELKKQLGSAGNQQETEKLKKQLEQSKLNYERLYADATQRINKANATINSLNSEKAVSEKKIAALNAEIKRLSQEFSKARSNPQPSLNPFNSLGSPISVPNNPSFGNTPAQNKPNPRQQEYMNYFSDISILDDKQNIEFIAFTVELSGELALHVSGSYRNAALVKEDDGDLIPNPYYYSRFTTDGIDCAEIEKLNRIFSFNIELKTNHSYILKGIEPAVAYYKGSRLSVERRGKLWLELK